MGECHTVRLLLSVAYRRTGCQGAISRLPKRQSWGFSPCAHHRPPGKGSALYPTSSWLINAGISDLVFKDLSLTASRGTGLRGSLQAESISFFSVVSASHSTFLGTWSRRCCACQTHGQLSLHVCPLWLWSFSQESSPCLLLSLARMKFSSFCSRTYF